MDRSAKPRFAGSNPARGSKLMSEKLISEQILEKIEVGIDAEIAHLEKRKGSEEKFPQQAAYYKANLLTNLFNYFTQESDQEIKLSRRMQKLLQELSSLKGEEYQDLINTLDKEDALIIAIGLHQMSEDLLEMSRDLT
jgi:hypothetical protein